MIKEFNELSLWISNSLHNGQTTDIIARDTNDRIYAICKKYSSKKKKYSIPASKSNCSSKNFNAIADANLKMYTRCVEGDATDDQALPYLLTWQDNKIFADISERTEFNIKNNRSWKCVSKNDPRKMWKVIDYNNKESKLEKSYIC